MFSKFSSSIITLNSLSLLSLAPSSSSMDADQILDLFDLYWFRHQILTTTSPPPPPPPTPNLEISIESPKPELSLPLPRLPSRHGRSLSDQLSSQASFSSDSSSPKSVLTEYKLQPIVSGKKFEDDNTKVELKLDPLVIPKQSRRNRGASRSLSELEFEELKGFMDLGFVFSEEDKNSSLVSILPGLQRLGNGEKSDGNEDEAEKNKKKKNGVSRPYLSEAWEVMSMRRKIENQFMTMNWRFPSPSNEIDMKHNLRSWAHNVASAVRV